MTGRPTVQHVADETCGVGQEDDITVVSEEPLASSRLATCAS
jgi:hypothetical protein